MKKSTNHTNITNAPRRLVDWLAYFRELGAGKIWLAARERQSAFVVFVWFVVAS